MFGGARGDALRGVSESRDTMRGQYTPCPGSGLPQAVCPVTNAVLAALFGNHPSAIMPPATFCAVSMFSAARSASRGERNDSPQVNCR